MIYMPQMATRLNMRHNFRFGRVTLAKMTRRQRGDRLLKAQESTTPCRAQHIATTLAQRGKLIAKRVGRRTQAKGLRLILNRTLLLRSATKEDQAERDKRERYG